MKIEIVISPTGQTRLETKVFSGNACQAASRFLEQALGQNVSEQAIAEAHQAGRLEAEEREGA